jgi:DNA-directed RNA polymerase subunit RPC12/RpoP
VACGVPFEPPQDGLAGSLAEKGLPPNRETSNSETLGRAATNVSVREHLAHSENDATTFRCENCGSEIDVLADQRSLRCPFCDSTYVVELSVDQRTKQRPEFVIGFEITKERALELFFQWLGKNSFFRPGDLIVKAATDKQQGIYIPFWHFSYEAESQWSAQIGEYWYRTETYTVKDSDGKTRTMTRTVQETEWWPLSGIHRKYYSGFMVSASKGLPQAEAMAIQPFRLNAMMRFRPMYLAGWMTEEYSISKEQALAITEEEFRKRETNSIRGFLPGDTHSGLRVQTELRSGDSDLILLPVHVLSYRYGDRVYRFLVNGQTGAFFGEKPWSAARITAVVIGIAMLVLVIVGLIIVLNHPRLGR